LVLAIADLTVFLAMGWALLAVRDRGVLGPELRGVLEQWVPRGYFGGVEFALALVVGLVATGNYGRGVKQKDAGHLFVGVALAVALTIWGDLLSLGWQVPVTYVVVVLVVWAALLLERVLLDKALRGIGWRKTQVLRAVFVGPLEECHGGAKGPAFRKGGLYRPVGFVDVAPADPAASLAHLRTNLIDRRAEAVVICGYLEDEVFDGVVQAAREAGCELLALPRRFKRTGVKAQLVWESDQPLIELASPALKVRHLMVKRIVDVFGAGVGLVLLSPLFALIAIAVKLDSRGPVFFVQERVGRGGRIFRLVKFRTMRVGADEEKDAFAHLNSSGDHRLFKVPNDPRMTRVGAWLRRWSLDEFPQLLNVLFGGMSLVGPRPFFEADLKDYHDHHFVRLGAKPGITGLWQVNGRSSVVDFEEVVRLDREYIDQWSLILDLRILLRTAPAVLRRTGAY
jgi:exopolysaccharide biosynthesis polyprenyl glycosylphosphotransferase